MKSIGLGSRAKRVVVALAIICALAMAGALALTAPANASAHGQQRVCAVPAAGQVSCQAHVLTHHGQPVVNSTPTGYGPAQIHGAYNLPATAVAPVTMAVVTAYGYSSAKSDLDVYDTTWGLPHFPSCFATVTTACFMAVDQDGGNRLPRDNAGWALEAAMDLQQTHEICQNCKLIHIQTKSASFADMLAGVDRALALGAKVVNGSWGGNESSSETGNDSHFNVTGVAFTFSSGDDGYGTIYPAASRYVTAVGGTSLHLGIGNTYGSESAWSGAGSGCSPYESKPSFQTDSGCAKRTVADVSAVADPYTGVAVYDTVKYNNKTGWWQVGGTSLSSPITAGVYALAGGVPAGVYGNSIPYAAIIGRHDVTTGSNGSCGGSYLCAAGPGFDGPTGLGTPNGITAY